ncbi:MAG: L-threonine 3-O-phosphate decarboxylase [uncultured Microvirga sp.]|uniref:8-amino-7-oxononanoate synthase n=1 Tax=uncultured Microvirga sp. TaxID=412392 RepID=A0A6J4MEI4_9HYPH|nr:MAG: L-threonine 3-O-phosphate decarboxylase [uncultured Microvirga sp.]
MGTEAIGHGGDLDEARTRFPEAEKPWIDLSTGINPVAYPAPALPDRVYRRLPSPGEVASLEAAAARAYGAADPATVVAAPGTQALIGWLPRLRPPGRVAVLGPTYAEHAAAWREGGHEVFETTQLDTPADVLVVVNPNNPDGRVLSRRELFGTADRLGRSGGWLVVDEAFVDLEPVESLAPVLPAAAVVLRSFGKAYGLAGLRLGFALADHSIAQRLRSVLGPWAVSGPAIAIGGQALADEDWRRSAALDRATDARRLDSLLAPAARVIGGTCLFRLVETPDAPALFDHLGRRGIWVRRFETMPHRLRFGLAGTEASFERLRAALLAFKA